MHRIATNVTGARKTVLIPRMQLWPSDPTIPFQLCGRRFPIKIAFAVTVSLKGRRLNVLEYTHYRIFPYPRPQHMTSCMWHFPERLHFTMSLLELLNDSGNV